MNNKAFNVIMSNIIHRVNNREHCLRVGQALFLESQKHYPHAVEKIRSTAADCFYRDEVVPLFVETLRHLTVKS